MPIEVRTLFLSDLHLGKPSAAVEPLAGFLEQIVAEKIFLVGDIVDLHYLSRFMHWPEAHARIFQTLVARAEAGTDMTYLPGNHDTLLRNSRTLRYGPVPVTDRLVHTGADGRRYLVIHGDQFDLILQKAPWLGPFGDRLYEAAIWIDRSLRSSARTPRTRGRRRPGFSARAKNLVKTLIAAISRTEQKMVAALRRENLDGIVCGHTHRADLRLMDGLIYANAGDWVESCTALLEHTDGSLEIVTGRDGVLESLRRLAAAPPAS